MSFRRNGRSALIITALFLASSGAFRLGAGVGEAYALEPDLPDPAANQELTCPETPAALAAALTRREQKAAADEAAVKQRAEALALAEVTIKDQLANLEQAEAKLSATIEMVDGAAEDDLLRLTEIYQAMKPKESATLFDAMEPDFAAGFLSRMNPESAAAILSGMSSEKAYAVSVHVAGRNALAPKE